MISRGSWMILAVGISLMALSACGHHSDHHTSPTRAYTRNCHFNYYTINGQWYAYNNAYGCHRGTNSWYYKPHRHHAR